MGGWLAQHLHDPNLIALDGSRHAWGQRPDTRKRVEKA